MSHTTSIKGIKITNIDILRSAIEELKSTGIDITLQEGGTPRAYYQGQQGMGPADFVVKLGSGCPYDIGLYKQEDGSFEPRTDFWGGHVAKLLGVKPSTPEKAQQAQLGKLFQMYGLHAAQQQARKQGLTTRRVAGENGAMKLVVVGFA